VKFEDIYKIQQQVQGKWNFTLFKWTQSIDTLCYQVSWSCWTSAYNLCLRD